MDLMGYKDLMVALGPNTGNAVVVTINNKAIKVLKINSSVL